MVLRINNDPWLSKENHFADLQEISSANQELGVLLNTDEVPGGNDALPTWVSFLESQNFSQLLFEFHPAKSAVKLGFASPRSTFRAHTIASNELRDLSPAQQISRWRRAVDERSCRFLLLHVSPTDSFSGFLDSVSALQQDLVRQGWSLSWPKPRVSWTVPSFAERHLAPILALLLAILFPILALGSSLGRKPWVSYFRIFSLTLIGACIVAAVAQNSWTRLEIVPFRGIKAAFAFAWLGAFAVLYPWKEIKAGLYQAVRRVDVLLAVIVLAAIGYVLVRMGNASAGWKAGWEQGLRDRLEDLLVARPRFKEFAIGYPLLFLGLQFKKEGKPKAFWQDGRFWIAVGMIGPISMVNTFCHLHSPLYLALWRSANGFLIGTVVGVGLLWIYKMSIVIAGYYGFGNAGDELILYSLIERFRRENPHNSITVFSQTPSETQDSFGVRAVDRWRPRTWIRPLFEADRFILGGGGLLQESTGPWNHAYYLSLLVLAKCFGCQTEIMAIGVDPIRGLFNRFWTRFVLNHWVDAISVRDEASRQALTDTRVTAPVEIQKDPVFDLKPERHLKRSGRIAFALSPSKRQPLWSRGVAELCDLLAKRLDVSIDFLVFFAEEDETFARYVFQYAAFETHVRMSDNPQKLLSWIPQYDLVVATRFHALALAQLSGVPFIGWGPQTKVATLCRNNSAHYSNTDEDWNLNNQFEQICSLYQSGNKSVILETRTA